MGRGQVLHDYICTMQDLTPRFLTLPMTKLQNKKMASRASDNKLVNNDFKFSTRLFKYPFIEYIIPINGESDDCFPSLPTHSL